MDHFTKDLGIQVYVMDKVLGNQEINLTLVNGIMEMLMVKEFRFLRMEINMKENSKKD